MGCSAAKMSGAAAGEGGGGGGSTASEPSSSAASAANCAVSASSANQHQQQQQHINAADVPQDVAPTVAEYVGSYSQLEALIDAHPTQFTAALLLPILTELLPLVVASIFGALVEVPIPQLTQSVSIIVAITRWLFILEGGGNWARWKPHLEMLYLLRGNRPVVLGDDNFGVFGSRAAFIGEAEAVRQWKILSWGVIVSFRNQLQLMNGNTILRFHICPYTPTLFASPVFPHVPFDPTDPPTKLSGLTYPNYTSMVAFVLFGWLYYDSDFPCIRSWVSWRRASAARRRVVAVLAASPSDEAQWGAGAAVFDKRLPDVDGVVRHHRLVVLGSEAVGKGRLALIWLSDHKFPSDVSVYTTEWFPHDKTRNAVMRMLGDQLGGKMWRKEDEVNEDRQVTACTVM